MAETNVNLGHALLERARKTAVTNPYSESFQSDAANTTSFTKIYLDLDPDWDVPAPCNIQFNIIACVFIVFPRI